MTMKRMFAAALCAVTGACIIGLAAQEAANPYTATVAHHADLPKVNPATSTSWADHNADIANSRYSPLNQITPANAGKLVLKWSYDLPKSESIGEETPLVVDGVMYFNAGSRLYAIDAVTGKPVWTF